MGRSKEKVGISGPWIGLPLDFIRSRAFAQLSPYASKLLFDLVSQLGARGFRNGDLTATYAAMKVRGWRSASGLAAAIRELLEARLVCVTRQGGRHQCSLYAVTLWPMNCDFAKLDSGPGCYLTSDWTQGKAGAQSPPTPEAPARWPRIRQEKDPQAIQANAERLAKLREQKAEEKNIGAPGMGSIHQRLNPAWDYRNPE